MRVKIPILTAIVFVIVLMTKWLFPSAIPYTIFQLWSTTGSLWQWLNSAWPIFIWGASCAIVISIFKKPVNGNGRYPIVRKVFVAVQAGVVEEICFRWLTFMSMIAGIKTLNFLFFGWLGFGIPKFIQIYIAGPISNLLTLGYLSDTLSNPANWAIGAALLLSNELFGGAHSDEKGWFGYLNSQLAGMFFFWLLFKYGLLACIVVHFLYDFLIVIIIYVKRKIGVSHLALQ